MALISDDLTRECLSYEVDIFNITPWNYKVGLKYWKADFLLVESAWNGYLYSWKGKIASYPNNKNRNNNPLKKVIEYAKGLGIKCIFWNKEDNVHFDRFISSASLFDYILTVDSSCIKKYKNRIKHDVKVGTLMFAVQPEIHSFQGFEYTYNKSCFVGTYNRLQHDLRRDWQDMAFKASLDFGLDIYDRRSAGFSKNYQYPDFSFATQKKRIAHKKTGEIYRSYISSLNVNTVTDSPTMFSRRLIEVIACGRVIITNPSESIEKHFTDHCEVVSTTSELLEVYSSLKDGYSSQIKDKLKASSDYVLGKHTYKHRLKEIIDFIKF